MGNIDFQKIKLQTKWGENLIKEFQKDSPVLLVGSPISEYPPTSLPSGRNFTEALFESLFYKDIFQPDPNNFEVLKKLFNATPFEHLLEFCPAPQKIENFILNLYNKDNANAFHQVIAEAFVKRKISAIITTNYDNCIDKELEKYDFPYKRAISEKEAYDCIGTDLPVYFKIHGSASIDADEKPIFTLHREAYLPQEKKELLEKLISGHKLILIAYSGLDFDICPTINRIRDVNLIWNTYTEEVPSVNANRLLIDKHGVQLIGDMKILFSNWIQSFEIMSKEREKAQEEKNILLQKFLSTFSKEERRTWQISILNSIAAPKPTLKTLNMYSIPLIGSMEKKQKARALFHAGRYFDSAWNYLFQAVLSFSKKDQYEVGDCLLETSDALRSSGAFLLSLVILILSWALGSPSSHTRSQLKYLLLMIRVAEVLRMFKITRSANSLRTRLKPKLIKCAKESVQNGNWFDYQQIGLLSQELGIPLSELEDATRYSPPDPKDGYEHLGYYLANIMVLLNEERSHMENDFPPSQKEKKCIQILKEVEKCKKLGLDVLTWKLYALLSHFVSKTDWIEHYQKEFHKYLNSCQYLPWGKMFQVRRYRIKN